MFIRSVAQSIDHFVSLLENSSEFAVYAEEIAAVHKARNIEKEAFDVRFLFL